MSDQAHTRTDRELQELEKRIAKVYQEARDDVADQIKAYFRRFQARDAAMQKRLAAGEITAEYYKQWRLNQIGRGRRFEDLRDKLAERFTDAYETAVAYVNDKTPSIYSLNRNYAAYTIEKEVGDVGFTLWDEQTVRRLIVEEPDVMPYYPPKRAVQRGFDLAYGKSQITKNVTSSILQGLSIGQMADSLQARVVTMSRVSAVRAARTAVTAAENAGRMDSYHAAEKMGIKMRKRWLSTLDGRTRHSHAILDGQTADVDKPFKVDGREIRFPGDPQAAPDLVYNCFVGETEIASDSKIIRSYKHEYTGDLVEIKTSGGVNFTCTPNHPILTPNGWVAAAFLNNGDDLLVALNGNTGGLRRNGNIEHIHSRMKALYNTLHRAGFMSRDSTLRINFHGDIPTSDVEIITKEWLLRDNGDSGARKSLNKFILKYAYKSFLGFSTFVKHFRRVCKTSLGFVRSRCKTLPFLWGSLRHSNIHRFRPISGFDVGISQNAIYDLTAETETFSKMLDGFTGKITADKIVNVKVISTGSSATQVYNLQTETGHYFVNSSISQNNKKCNGIYAIAKNCRCSLIASVVDIPQDDALRRDRSGLMPDMTFAQWERQKRGERVLQQ